MKVCLKLSPQWQQLLNFILCWGRDLGLRIFLRNTLLKNRLRWLRCFTEMKNDTIFLPTCIAVTRNKQVLPFLKLSEMFQRAKTNSTSKNYTGTKPLHEDVLEQQRGTCWIHSVVLWSAHLQSNSYLGLDQRFAVINTESIKSKVLIIFDIWFLKNISPALWYVLKKHHLHFIY